MPPGESTSVSRVQENCTHGSTGGRWKRAPRCTAPASDPTIPTLSEARGLVSILSGKEAPTSARIVGRGAVTQTAGIHADVDLEVDLYAN